MGCRISGGLRLFVLVLLTLQNAGQTIILKLSQQRGSHPDTMELMLVVEVCKLVGSVVMYVLCEADSSWQQHFMPTALRRTVALAPPAILFVVQNQVLFVAVTNLDAPVFQALSQLKILFAGVFSVLLLKKQLSSVQWVALLLLACGAALVQIEASLCKEVSANQQANPFAGLLAVIVVVSISGLAGCYTEKMLKSMPLPMWLQSAEVAFFSAASLSMVLVWARTGAILTTLPRTQDSFGKGFNFYTWLVIAVMAVGGLIVVMALKHADNVMKGMAVVASLIVTSLTSTVVLGSSISPLFGLATIIICCSMYLYQAAPAQDPKGPKEVQGAKV